MSQTAAEGAWVSSQVLRKAALSRERKSRWQEGTSLALTVMGAILASLAAGTATENPVLGSVLGTCAAVAILLSPIIGHRAASNLKLSATIAICAEEIESMVVGRLLGTGQFKGLPEGDRDSRLITAVFGGLLSQVPVKVPGAIPWEIDAPVNDDSHLPPITDLQAYVEHRLDPKISDYYYKETVEAVRANRVARLARILQVILGVAAAILGGLAAIAVLKEASTWIGVAGTAMASIAAGSAVSRSEQNAKRCAIAMVELRVCSVEAHLLGSSARTDSIIEGCEAVMARERAFRAAEFGVDAPRPRDS